MFKPGDHVRGHDGMEGYIVGRVRGYPSFFSVHIVPEQRLHEDSSGTLPGRSFWDYTEMDLVKLSWEQEDI